MTVTAPQRAPLSPHDRLLAVEYTRLAGRAEAAKAARSWAEFAVWRDRAAQVATELGGGPIPPPGAFEHSLACTWCRHAYYRRNHA